MAYQEVTKTSYGKNLGNSFKGIFTGILLVIAGTIAIFWNENRAIKKFNDIDRTESACVEMNDINTVSDFEGKPIHATGVAVTVDTLIDEYFGVKANAISIKREVEFYQKVEHSSSTSEDKWGGATATKTDYTYENEWVSKPQKDVKFKDPNEKNNNIVLINEESNEIVSKNVTFGAYKMADFAGRISGSEPVEIALDSAVIAKINSRCKQSLGLSDSINANYVNVINKNTIYIGGSPDNSEIGDVRVTFTYVPNNKTVSIIAGVSGDTFIPYKAKNGTISSLVSGTQSAEQMFDGLRSGNKTWTWILRIVILLVIIGGFKSMVSIVPALLKVIPFLGKGAEAILGFVCTIIGFIWTLLFTAIAWIAVRPLLGISLLVVVVALIVWLVKRSKKAEQQQPEVTETEVKQ